MGSRVALFLSRWFISCNQVVFPSHYQARFQLASEPEQLWACCGETGKLRPSSCCGEYLLCWRCHEEPLQSRKMRAEHSQYCPSPGRLLNPGRMTLLSELLCSRSCPLADRSWREQLPRRKTRPMLSWRATREEEAICSLPTSLKPLLSAVLCLVWHMHRSR